MKACDIPDECIEDPRFIKVLGASLCSEVAESKIILTETNVEIERLKDDLSRSWEKRKVLKQSVNELRQMQQVFTTALESLSREVKHRTSEIATAKNRLDDATLREIEERSKFMKILDNYRDTWQKYKVEYESRPLAVERQKSCVNVKQLEVQRRVVEYRRNEFLKMLKQRKEIDAMRIKVSLVDLSRMMLKRWNYEKQLDLSKKLANKIGNELTDYNRRLMEVQQAVERKKLSELEETVKMPPPRLDFRFMRNHQQHLQAGRSMSSKSREAWIRRDESDTTSINTLMLEEMCVDDVIDRVEERSGKNIPNKWTNDLNDKNSSCSYFSTPRSAERASRINSNNSVRHKLQRLDIEKQSNRKRSSSMSMPIDDFYKDNNAKIGVNDDAVETADSSRQRTRRWCEETSLAHRNMTSGYVTPEIPQERELLKSPSPNVESAMEQNVTARINDDDESQLDCRSSLNFSPIQRVTNISVENQENHQTDGVSTPPLRSNMFADSAVVVDEGNACTSVLKDANVSKDAMNDEDTNGQDYADVRSKKRKISKMTPFTIDSPLMTPQRDTREKSIEPSIIANLNGSIDNSSFHENISNGRRFVPSSYMSSDDLQQITSQGTFGLNRFKVGAGRCPSFSNWENWSPSKQPSIASFSPSSITDKRDENNVTSMINRKDEQQPDESSEPTTNFAHGFFKKTANNPRKMF